MQRQDGEEQRYSGDLRAEIERLNSEAEGVVNLAIKESQKHPDMSEDIYQEALNRILGEIFRDGCLGPATAAADPTPFVERLGQAFDQFEERVFQDDLDLTFVVEVAVRASRLTGKSKYYLGKRADTPSGMETVTLDSRWDADKAMHKLQAEGVSIANLGDFDIIEDYWEVYRGQVRYDGAERTLTVKGRIEFVREVLDEEEEEDESEEEEEEEE